MRPMHVLAPELEPPKGRDFWVQVKEDGRPIFTTKVVSSVFFGHSKPWLARHLILQHHKLDGQLVDIPRSPTGVYQFQLAHVERIAHAFFSHAIIDINTFENCLIIVKAIGSNYRLI